MKNKLLVLAMGVALSLCVVVPGHASNHTLSLKSSVTIPETGKATVRHTFTSRNADKENLPGTATLAVSGHDVQSVSAKTDGGDPLSTSYNESTGQIELTIPESRRDRQGSWSFSISYKTTLAIDQRSVTAAQIAAIQTNLAVTSHEMTISADLELGFASVRGPKPTKTGIGVGQQRLTYSDKDGQLEIAPILMFGDSTHATLTFDTTLTNDSWWWQEKTLTLPPDTNQQKVLLDSVEPKPANMRLDRDGNILAVYRLRPRQSIDVTAKLNVTLDVFDYKLENAGSVDSTDQLLKDRYTRLTDNWQPIGVEIEADGSDAAVLVKQVFDAVIERAESDTQNQQLQLATRSGALRYSDWLVGELRSRGVPARVVVGLLGSDGQRLLEIPNAHAWAEAYIAGTGWVTLDPWLAMQTGGFTGSDSLRTAVGLWGIEEDRPPVVLDGMSLAYNDEPTTPANPSEASVLTATKYVILPFLSVLSVESMMPAGAIVDDAAIQVGDSTIELGSVSPLQTSRYRFARLGSAAFNSEPATLGQMDGEFAAWQEIQSDVSYVPLIIIGGTLALLLVLWWWRRRRSSLRRKTKPSKDSLTFGMDAEGGDVELENLVEPPPTTLPRPSERHVERTRRPDLLPERRSVARPEVRRSATITSHEAQLRTRQRLIQ